MTFRGSINMAAFAGMMDEIADTAEATARPAAQAGIQVLYEQVKINVAGLGRKTGNLASSIYQVYSTDHSGLGHATYHVSWNTRKAPHGWLVENGHLMRYRMYQGGDGQIRPMVRPRMEGMPKPGRHASQAQKDAYYVPLPVPLQIPAKAFVRNAASRMPQAQAAAEAVMRRAINHGD